MAFFVWNDKYSVGIRELDNQHKQLMNILNELYDAMQNATAQDRIGRIINELTNYTKIHFATEERYMEAHNYPALSSQKVEHQRFIQKVGEFKQDFESGKIALSLNVANFVKDWLSSHILGSDKNYGPFLNAKGVS